MTGQELYEQWAQALDEQEIVTKPYEETGERNRYAWDVLAEFVDEQVINLTLDSPSA